MRYASITERLADLGSGKWSLHIRARQLKASGADIIELTIGEPDLLRIARFSTNASAR